MMVSTKRHHRATTLLCCSAVPPKFDLILFNSNFMSPFLVDNVNCLVPLTLRLDFKVKSMFLFFGNVPRFSKELPKRYVSYVRPNTKYWPNKKHLDSQHKHKKSRTWNPSFGGCVSCACCGGCLCCHFHCFFYFFCFVLFCCKYFFSINICPAPFYRLPFVKKKNPQAQEQRQFVWQKIRSTNLQARTIWL